MFERFTDRARRVVVLAQEEGRAMNHDYIGVEHLLLGLMAESEGVAAKSLSRLGFSLPFLQNRVAAISPAGVSGADVGHIPFTWEAKKCLESSLREALELGHNYIGTEHILLGMARNEPPTFMRLIQDVTPSDVRSVVLRELRNYAPNPADPDAPVKGWLVTVEWRMDHGKQYDTGFTTEDPALYFIGLKEEWPNVLSLICVVPAQLTPDEIDKVS